MLVELSKWRNRYIVILCTHKRCLYWTRFQKWTLTALFRSFSSHQQPRSENQLAETTRRHNSGTCDSRLYHIVTPLCIPLVTTDCFLVARNIDHPTARRDLQELRRLPPGRAIAPGRDDCPRARWLPPSERLPQGDAWIESDVKTLIILIVTVFPNSKLLWDNPATWLVSLNILTIICFKTHGCLPIHSLDVDWRRKHILIPLFSSQIFFLYISLINWSTRQRTCGYCYVFVDNFF